MKIAVVADLHFRGKNLEDKKRAWSQAVDKMIEQKVDMVILAGDTFDRRNIADREGTTGAIFRAFMDPVNRLLVAKIEVVAVRGNGIHEGNNGEQPGPMEVLKETKIRVVDQTFLLEERYCEVDCLILFIPAIDKAADAQELASGLKKMKKRLAAGGKLFKLVVGHLTVKGAALNSGIEIMGSEFEVEQEQLEDLGADMVALGHIHKRQQIGKNIHYVGALSQNNFGEEGNPSGFMIIDTDKRTHEFVEIDAPEYQTLNGWEKFKKPLPKPRDYVKYRFKEKPENLDELLANENTTVEIVPDREEVHREVEGVEAGRSEGELLDAYLTHRGWEKPARERIIKRAKELMEAIA